MQPLSLEKRAQILHMLCEGMSNRAVSRITGSRLKTILALLEKAGEACAHFQDVTLRNLDRCRNVQLDELHSFIGCKDSVKKHAKGEHPGSIWTWIAICADTKLRITWHIGDRSSMCADSLCHDLSIRIPADAQVTSDGLHAYRPAMRGNMPGASFAQLVKVYETDEWGNDIVVSAEKMPVFGDPDPALINTSYVEASNLHLRMQNRRFSRKTNAHSKSFQNHCHMIAVAFAVYNFVRKHHALEGQTPAMAAGAATHVWTMLDLVQMIDAYHAEKMNSAFTDAFAAMPARFTPRRKGPKTYPPTPKDQIKPPWYLDPNSDGPPLENP